MIPEETVSLEIPVTELRMRRQRPPIETALLWSAIGLAGALLIVLLLGGLAILSLPAMRIAGAILTWLCAVIMILAVVYAIKNKILNS